MKRTILTILPLLAGLLAARSADAAHFRHGALSWQIPDPGKAPLTVEIAVRSGWQSASINGDGTTVDFGDGSLGMFTLGVPAGGGVDAEGGVYTVTEYRLTHTYPSPGVYVASFHDCCRDDEVINGSSAGYRVEAVLDLGGHRSGGPVAAAPALAQLAAGGLRSFTVPVFDPDLAPISCRFGTAAESALPAGFEIPSIPGSAAQPALAMTAAGCEVTWDLAAAQPGQRYALHLVMESTRAGVISSGAVDLLGEVVGASPPTCAGGGQIVAPVGQPVDVSFTGTAPGGGALWMTSIGVPDDAVLTPIAGAAGASPMLTTLSWTPQPSDAGTTRAITIAYADHDDASGTCALEIFVPACADFGAPCTSGLGPCAVDGANVCAGAKTVCNGIALPGQPETCNGVDDDCDGVIDNGFGVGEPCADGLGACAVSGVIVCDGPDASTCSVKAGAPSPELCNGVDDDCNGVVDDGCHCDSDAACGAAGMCDPFTSTCVARALVIAQGNGVISCNQSTGESPALSRLPLLLIALLLRRRR